MYDEGNEYMEWMSHSPEALRLALAESAPVPWLMVGSEDQVEVWRIRLVPDPPKGGTPTLKLGGLTVRITDIKPLRETTD